ncbi:MAG: ABC transporter ATP-binding protein [Alphaproteobacteria bacterium]
MAHIQIRNLVKRFGEVEVLHGIGFEIADQELVVLVGPSGCGKTTLLRMIAGLEDVTEGEIALDGRVINHVREKDRDIAMVFQNYALYPHMTVYNNMSFSLRMRKMPKPEQQRRIRWVAEMLQLEEYLDRYPRQLSGGQRQRVAMGRALVREPMAFLLDEPLSNLDAQLRVQMRAEIRALHQRLKATSVYVTHDQVEAMTLADRVVIMRDGHIEQIGSPDVIYDRPANTFVAGFIGSPAMNMLPGHLRRHDDKAWVEFPGGAKIEMTAALDGEDGVPVFYGVRPEDLNLGTEQDGWGLEVEVVEMTGREIEIYGMLQGVRVCTLLRERQRFSQGDTVWLQPDSTRAHLFQADTGISLLAG